MADKPVSMQVAGNCKKAVCDGAGQITDIADDTDVPSDDGDGTYSPKIDYPTYGGPGDLIAANVRDKRALRTAAKEAFVLKYVEITHRVKAEFPGDDALQDLFFDEVRGKSAVSEADGDPAGDPPGDKPPQPTSG